MSCYECSYITGHAQSCSRYAAEADENLEARLLARIEALEERVRELEERNQVRDMAVLQTGGRIPR